MNQVVGECLWSLHSASMSLQVVNRELMMSHLHRMTSYSRAQQMIDPAHPLILFIVQVCTCIIAHVHLCMLCMSICVLRCVCCAACVVLFVLRCVCCAALHLFMTSLLMSVCRPCHGIHRKWSSWFILWTRGTCEQLVLLWVH